MDLITIRNGRPIARRAATHGILGNAQALGIMAQLVRDDAKREDLRNWLLENVLRGVRGHDFDSEVEAMYRWAKDAVRYTRDPAEAERLADLATTIKTGAGDCKSKSVALATMLALMGHQPFFMVMSQMPWENDPRWEFKHVYVGLEMPDGSFKMLDPTPETFRPGMEAGAMVKKKFAIFPSA